MAVLADISPEANALKIQDSPMTFNLQVGESNSDPLLVRFLEGMKRAIDPVKYTADLAKASQESLKAFLNAYRLCKESIPSLSDEQAICLASGYMFTPGEASNVTAVFLKASKDISEDFDPDALSMAFKDCFVKGSATAYDEEVRLLWSDLLGAETKAPGSFSKRTMKILESMDGEDARAFKTLCASSFRNTGVAPLVPIIIESAGDTYPFGAWNHANKLGTLAALGLIDKSPWVSFPILPGRDRKIAIGEEKLVVGNVGTEEISLNFGHARFLPSGLELATLCDVGTADDLIDAAKMAVHEMSPDLMVVED